MRFYKDPDAVLDFLFDWTEWLAVGEAISSHTITVSGTGVAVDSSSENSGIITVWLSGGTAGQVDDVNCQIVTDAARTDERTMKIRIQER
jgi:hypothetical protein